MQSIVDVTLIASGKQDALHQTIADGPKRTVYGKITSVTGSEFTNAGILGIRADLRVLIYGPDYQNELTAVIGGVPYSVYRTYRNPSNRVELYLTRRAGDEYEHQD